MTHRSGCELTWACVAPGCSAKNTICWCDPDTVADEYDLCIRACARCGNAVCDAHAPGDDGLCPWCSLQPGDVPWEHENRPAYDRTGTVDEAWSLAGITVWRSGQEYGYLTVAGDSGGPYPSFDQAFTAARA